MQIEEIWTIWGAHPPTADIIPTHSHEIPCKSGKTDFDTRLSQQTRLRGTNIRNNCGGWAFEKFTGWFRQAISNLHWRHLCKHESVRRNPKRGPTITFRLYLVITTHNILYHKIQQLAKIDHFEFPDRTIQRKHDSIWVFVTPLHENHY